ncbi:DUF934 domain-containing protein [SAR92 clade bacterium H231]|jgi:uncharacterized protein (DUF934 family)|nr:DUF934 domain-containing protein [Porticoccaceae bacterium]MCT2532344.1 DUF934 domain-containing protein [SAR92 clade bacterium H231]MBT6320247.1 DUF934 domain-containing protein [Porticoccaceae bacterium]MDA7815773.1 DUF934 domain-containing protein [Porticoccaceae bacterium]MDA8903682.1 DUF934 domain-containing protein [Porticoccaceae bacterium]
MAQLLKEGQVVDNSWSTVVEDAGDLPPGDILLPLQRWLHQHSQLSQHSGRVGLWIEGNEEIEAVAEQLIQAPVVAIRFPKFVDGRGFSAARLLRERYGYQGEIRATGEIIRDQLYLLQRCGFNAFEFGEEVDLAEASKSLADFSDAYQVAADQPIPLFKRR